MSTEKLQSNEENPKKKLRLLPGIIIASLIILLRYVLLSLVPETLMIGFFAGMIGWLAIVIWWGFFSRANKYDRWPSILFMVIALAVTFFLLDESIATGGSGLMLFIFGLPILGIAFVFWTIAARNLPKVSRRVAMAIIVILACIPWTLLRNKGITGDFGLELTWRWSQTDEEKFLAQNENKKQDIQSTALVTDSVIAWPGFRGTNRDAVIHGVQIATNWSKEPPKELWRKPVGQACSSFAVHGDFFFTQEQYDDKEVVSCYNIKTGEPVWKYSYEARFWDSHAGAGPRSTPTLDGKYIYTMGATGILTALEASTGKFLWSRNTAEETKTKDSGWGYCSSPVVTNDLVIVAAIGKLVAYNKITGKPAWQTEDGGDSYSSPHLTSIEGVEQMILLSGKGIRSFAPVNGKLVWDYPWDGMSRITQPAKTPDGDYLMSGPDGKNIRRVAISKDGNEWKFEDKWTSSKLRPNFNDFVIHKGHAYGFDGPFLACIDIKDGSRKWKGKRYGGQILLLADQDLLIVLTEKGELALVKAMPEEFTEVSEMSAIEGKTWNHPVLVNDILLVRNLNEMVGYEMVLAGN